MLIKQRDLDALAAGKLDLAFRRWERPRVKVGTRLRTSHGVVEVLAVDVVPMTKISDRDARRAGCADRRELLAVLRRRPKGRVHRVRLRRAGEDPRVALRARSRLTAAERTELEARLARMDRASREPWTTQLLSQ